MDLTAEQVLAHRASVQGLSGGDLGVLALGVVDSPPNTGEAALAVRRLGHGEPLVRVLSLRGAPHLHRPADLPALRRQLRPRTPEQLAAWCGAHPVPALEHVDLVVAAMGAAMAEQFSSASATKGELSGAITASLPPDVRPHCGPCGTGHVIEGLFRLCTLLAGLELEPAGVKLLFRRPIAVSAGSAGRDPSAGADPAVPGLVRDHARFVGPFAKADVLRWLGAGPQRWPESVPVRVGGRRLHLPADDPGGWADPAPEPPAGLLLFPRDPYLLGPRWLLADADVAKRVWRPVGSPGALVVHGRVVGAWRYAFSGRTMSFHVERWSAVRGAARRAVRDQADVLAGVWGRDALGAVVVEW
ncbi:crosslink repair DNA glycosylase YcaQ family protein [Actinosynnema sp. NPDC050436]|uniref:DNA glycosylase AlkZ-like family protein n=1 Tax=Actinosynnema sp. NPDC050436 TaxID=3155659 RepID=UPI00340D4803